HGLACTDVGALLLAEDDTAEAARELARLAAATGAPVCIAAVASPKPPGKVLEDLRRSAEILSAGGVRVALEFTSYGGLLGLEEAIALCDAAGWEAGGLLGDSLPFART